MQGGFDRITMQVKQEIPFGKIVLISLMRSGNLLKEKAMQLIG